MESNETFVIYLTSGSGVKLSPLAQTEVIIIIDDDDLQTEVIINEDYGKYVDYVAFILVYKCMLLYPNRKKMFLLTNAVHT